MFSDVIVNPAFDAKEFARVRDNLLTAITRAKDSPPTVANLAMTRLLYGQKHPYGWPMTGVEPSIKKITPRTCAASTTSTTGRTTPRCWSPAIPPWPRSRASSRAAFAKWSPKHSAASKLPAPAGAAPADEVFLIDKAEAPQSSIASPRSASNARTLTTFP